MSPSPQIIIPSLLLEVGTRIRVQAFGQYSAASTQPLMTLGFFTGTIGQAITSAVVMGTTTGISLSASASAWPFRAQLEGQVRTLGTGGTILLSGFAKQGTSLTLFAASDFILPVTAAGRTVTLDTTVNRYIAFGVIFAPAGNAPTLTCNDLTVELLG